MDGSVSSFSLDSNSTDVQPEDKRTGSSEELKRLQSMIKTETQTIRLWRLVILVTLLAGGAAVSAYTYLYLSDNEEKDFITAVSIIRFY